MYEVLKHNPKVCEKCKGTYAGGKEYGNYWCQIRLLNVELKGLCEFCNPKSVWCIA